MRRSDQRRDAAFALYQRDVTGRPLEDLLADAKPFTRELATGADADLEAIDAAIAANARGWSLERIAPLERGIMRVAVFEILHREEIPVAVSIDEAVSSTRPSGGAVAPGYVNGTLAAGARGVGAEEARA